MNYRTSNYLPRDFLAKVSAAEEPDEDMKTAEELYSSMCAESLKPKNLGLCFLRMLRHYSTTTKDGLLKPSSIRWMNWGIMRNGVCLTGGISETRPERESISLRYFGTKKAMPASGMSKPYRSTLVAQRGREMRTVKENRKICELPSELYEHLQGFPIGWTAGIPSTRRKFLLGNAVNPNIVKAITENLEAIRSN